MQLTNPTSKFINKTLVDYEQKEGHHLNSKLLELFKTFKDPNDLAETKIKVAALNKLYSTAIIHIDPVVDKIIEKSAKYNPQQISDYIDFVDEISRVEWTNKSKKKTYKRNNMSFASKYVHFLSENKTPIYDSYIWIVIKGYLGQHGISKFSFTSPKTYSSFFETYNLFINEFALDDFKTYEIDKFIWQYGRSMIGTIKKELGGNLEDAKRELKRRIKNF